MSKIPIDTFNSIIASLSSALSTETMQSVTSGGTLDITVKSQELDNNLSLVFLIPGVNKGSKWNDINAFPTFAIVNDEAITTIDGVSYKIYGEYN